MNSVTIFLPGTTSSNISNVATVTAHPVLHDGTDIPKRCQCNASDHSAVTIKQADYSPKVLIDNTPYLGHDGGKHCGTKAAPDYVEGMYGTNVTYYFTVTNLGDT